MEGINELVAVFGWTFVVLLVACFFMLRSLLV